MPWPTLDAPHPYVCDWLDDPVEPPPGRRAVVIGCGLGDDAAELARRGFEVTAFDISRTAVRRAEERSPDVDVDWRVADLLQLPEELVGAFDLVVEVLAVPLLPGVVRDAAMHAIGTLAAPGGVVLVVAFVAADAATARDWTGPPWPQAPSEFAAYRAAGLERLALEHGDPDDEGTLVARITWRRGALPG